MAHRRPKPFRNYQMSEDYYSGLSPSMTIVAVDGEQFEAAVLKDAVTAAKNDTAPISLLMKDFNQYQTVTIDYHEGLKYPHLVRTRGRMDYLGEVLRTR